MCLYLFLQYTILKQRSLEKTVRVFVYITIRLYNKHIEKYRLISHLKEIRNSTQRLAPVEKPDTFCTKKCAFHWIRAIGTLRNGTKWNQLRGPERGNTFFF